jgi:hypothetical protein
MAGVLTDMAQVVLGWALAFVAIAGWGHLVHRLCGPFTLTLELWLEHFWLGLVAVLAFLQIWNLFLPVDWRAGLVVALIGFPATLVWLPRLSSVRLSRSQILTLMLCVPVFIRLACQSLLPPSHYDSGLYHFNAIRWHMEYALPPGLGNLHGRLAFNISYFLYVALLNVYPWFKHGHNIALSLWLAVLTLQFGLWIRRTLVHSDQINAPMLLRICLLPVVFATVGFSPLSERTYHTLASPSPDVPLFIWGLLMFLKFVDYLCARAEANDDYSPLVICSMAMGAMTLKLNLVVFGLAIIAVTAGVWFYRSGKVLPRIVIALLALGLLILVPWSARGIVMSGYPCYPMTAGGLSVDWRVPREDATDMARRIVRVVPNSKFRTKPHWQQVWFENSLSRPVLKWPLIALGVSSVMLLVYGIRFRLNPKLLIPIVPCLLSVAYWYMGNPNVRFVGSALWLLALWPAALTLSLAAERIRLPWRSLLLIGLVVLAVTPCVKTLSKSSPHFRGELEGFAPIPTAPLQVYKTASGLEIWVAVNRDQKTWDAPLPCAHYPPGPNLELRGPSLGKGFRVRPGGPAIDKTTWLQESD